MTGLGLDGGGSATRWALCDDAGARIAGGELPSISGHLSNEPARELLRETAALLRAALPVVPERVLAGITGLSAEAPEAAIAAGILAESLGVQTAAVQVSDDLWIAYHGVFRPGEGHTVYAGTGSVGMHVRADGTVIQVGGRGMLIDDAGGAFWIGREALNLIYRRIDDDPAATSPLAEAVWADVGDRTWPGVRTHVYAQGRNHIAQLARAVARAAEQGDADAHALLYQAGQELARLARALVWREGRKPVALLGRAAALHGLILDGFREGAPELDVTLHAPDAALAAARIAVGVRGGASGQ
jgi:N-acetylglucosamine kinase-like BadF-type ATPase